MHRCLTLLHTLLTRGHPAVVRECAGNASFLKSMRESWLRSAQQPGADALSAQFLADFAQLLMAKTTLLLNYPTLAGNYADASDGGGATSLAPACAQQALALCNAVVLLIGPLVANAASLTAEQSVCAAIAPQLVEEASNAFVLASHVCSAHHASADVAALASEYAAVFERVQKLFAWAKQQQLPVQLFPLPPACPTYDGAFEIPLPPRLPVPSSAGDEPQAAGAGARRRRSAPTTEPDPAPAPQAPTANLDQINAKLFSQLEWQ